MELFDDTSLYILIPLILGAVWYLFLRPKPPAKIVPSITPTVRRAKKVEEELPGVKVKILYASQTGTAEEFSHKLGQESKRFGFAPKIVDIENLDRVILICFDPQEDELPQETFIIILAATYGEGEPTDNSRCSIAKTWLCREFHDWILDESLDKDLLKNVQYTVNTYESHSLGVWTRK